MARRQTRSKKPGVISLLVLVVLLIAYRFNKEKKQPDAPREYPTEQTKAKKHRKPKTDDIRALKTFTGKVIGIKDGDTFEVLFDSIPERVRLAEIDCPEKAQAYGKNAKQFASDLCFGKTVTVSSGGKRDRYGRVVGTVVTEDGTNVNEALVKAGFAWHYKDYSDNAQIGIYEREAREKQLGLWADNDPTPPWDWRKSRRRK
ncbi:thermonuclease family protein [Flavobacterium sp. RHBU_24]|uniref:thermonuclease family protein n=1 Tax=Flavobacterium sp. RHBU_24 TaxID=3391185 RepID=UPI003984EDC7